MAALTQAELLAGFSKALGDYHASVTTSAGAAGGTTLLDTKLTPAPDNALRGRWVRLPATSAEADKNRLATAFTQSTGTLTVTPGFTAQVGSAVAYQLHRYDPTLKLQALNDARAAVFAALFVRLEDTSLTVTAGQYEYSIPSAAGPELRQVQVQQQTTPADYPYKRLWEVEEWEEIIAPSRKLRLSAAIVDAWTGMKLRLVSVRPVVATALDADASEVTDADDAQILYAAAAEKLFVALASSGPAQSVEFAQQQYRHWRAGAQRLVAGSRRAWPLR